MKLTLPPQNSDHALGPEKAKVTLLIYADLQCPHSKKAIGWIYGLIKEDKDLRFIYRHFPLVDLHTYAVFAALATEASALQGRFWEYHKLLFTTKEQLSPLLILRLAKEINLDTGKLMSAMNKGILLEKVYRDLSSGIDSGVRSTPVFFLNGICLEGPLGFDHLLENIRCIRQGKRLSA